MWLVKAKKSGSFGVLIAIYIDFPLIGTRSSSERGSIFSCIKIMNVSTVLEDIPNSWNSMGNVQLDVG